MDANKKILYVEDVEELRQLTTFMIQSHFACEITEAQSGRQAIDILKKNSNFDLIVSDYNMPDGRGDEIYKFILEKSLSIPFVILSGNNLANNPILSKVKCYDKPLSAESLAQMIQENIREAPSMTPQYLPVPLALLQKMKEIHCTVFVKINEDKFVKLLHKGSQIKDEDISRHSQHGLSTLYIDLKDSEIFIRDYRKKVLSHEAWKDAEDDNFEDSFKLNTELLRSMGQLLAANQEFTEITVLQVETALKIISKNKKFSHLVQRFRKIENFSFADHCISLVYVAGCILKQLKPEQFMSDLRVITLASLIHDVSLNDRLYALKLSLLSSGKLKDLHKGGADPKEIEAHPAKAAILARDFDFCNEQVALVIEQHHELPFGKGFPKSLKTTEIHELAALFIVAEDFVDYFIRFSPSPDWKTYIQSREKIYVEGAFAEAFNVLRKNLISFF
jgi:CheY-like chemotaxis protein